MKNVSGSNAGLVEVGFTLAQGTKMYGSYARGLLKSHEALEASHLGNDNVYSGAFKKCNCNSRMVAAGECQLLAA